MLLDAHVAHSRNLDLAVVQGLARPYPATLTANLGEGKGVPPALAFEAGIARLLPPLYAGEEALESPVEALQGFLQDLGVHPLVLRPYRFDLAQKPHLLVHRDRLPGLPPGLAALLQGGVVQFPGQVQDMHQRSFLGLGGVQAVYESFFVGGMLDVRHLLSR
jgi:hypothetical protein